MSHRAHDLLVVSSIGCGPPFCGNRVRMGALLGELRRMGVKIHAAGLGLTAEESESLRLHADRWHGDLAAEGVDSFRDRARRWLARQCVPRGTRSHLAESAGVDRWFDDRWLAAARALQRRHGFARVLVPYVFHSKILEAFPPSVRRVIDCHDVFSTRAERLESAGISRMDAWFWTTPVEERRGLARASHVIAIQDLEARYLREMLGTVSSTQVLTVGHFVPIDPCAEPDPSVATIGYLAGPNPLNVDGIRRFLSDAWPSIMQHVPDARLIIAGGVCEALQPLAGVELLGTVPDVRDFYRRCAITINPMRTGTGLKIKTVEALAHGRCVIATSVGAEGIDGSAEDGLIACPDVHGMSAPIVELLRDRTRLVRLGRSAPRICERANSRSRRALQDALGIEVP